MALSTALGVYGNGVGVVTPIFHRLAILGLIKKSSGNTIRPGLFWGGVSAIVTGASGMTYNVAAFTAALSRGAAQGAMLIANDGTVSVATTTAPVSNSRYDVVYLWQRDYAIDGTNSTPVIGVVNGTAAASPTVPSLAAFPGAIPLAQILVPAGVTATNTGTTITQTFPVTTTDGGADDFPDLATAQRSITAPVAKMRARINGFDFIYDATYGWVQMTIAMTTVVTIASGTNVFTFNFGRTIVGSEKYAYQVTNSGQGSNTATIWGFQRPSGSATSMVIGFNNAQSGGSSWDVTATYLG